MNQASSTPESPDAAPAEILVTRSAGVARVVVSNERRRNALTLAMKRQLAEAFAQFEQEPDIRCIVLSGAGSKSFVSGADLSEPGNTRTDAAQEAEYRKLADGALLAPLRSSKPVIASIRGACVGGGLQLAVTCDIRIAARSSFFVLPAAKLGVGYPYASIGLYVSLLGRGRAADLFMSGRRLQAQEALEVGLINRVVDDDALDDAVAEYAATIAGNAPLALRLIKESIRALTETAHEAPPAIRQLMNQCTSSQDLVEGRKAFLEKRKPVFQGR